MKIAIISDHTGYELKKFLIHELKLQNKYKIIDLQKKEEKITNYALLGIEIGKYVVKEKINLGIAICGTGIGISVACNKIKGVFCALCSDVLSARFAKTHNNANIIALGARLIAKEHAIAIINEFLKNKFESGRHNERIKILLEY